MLAVTNPVMMQSGIVGVPQQIEGMKELFQSLDISNYERFVNLNPPPPQQPPPPPVAAFIKPKFSDLKDNEQAQVLASVGVQPDMPMRGYDNDRRVASEEAEIAKQIIDSMGA
jgi:hypothetical protein